MNSQEELQKLEKQLKIIMTRFRIRQAVLLPFYQLEQIQILNKLEEKA